MKKIRYFLDGIVVSHVIDRVLNNFFIRNIDNKEIVFRNNKVICIKQNIKLKAVDKPESKTLFIEDNNIGSFDIETYRNNNGETKVYALGFKSNLDKDCYIKYINRKTLDSDEIILDVVNELLRSKYSKITAFYCHNLGGFDIVFLLKALYRYNDNNEANQYKVKCILRDDKIINVKISRNKESFTLKDSYPMLPSSLSELGKSFDVAAVKTHFLTYINCNRYSRNLTIIFNMLGWIYHNKVI